MIRNPSSHTPTARHLLFLLSVPLALCGTGYALYTQNLSVATTTTKPAYSSAQNLLMTYTPTITKSGNKLLYTVSMTVTNRGTATVDAWQVVITMPSDTSKLTCPATIVCSQVGTTLTISNGAANGTITGGSNTTFNWTFLTAVNNYVFQNVSVSGHLLSTFELMAGLTASSSMGTRTKSGKNYRWPVTFTVTNNTGQYLTAWQLTIDWSTATNGVVSMPATVTYIATATNLIMTSTTGLANGASFQFIPTLQSTNMKWTATNLIIKGKV